MFFAFGLAVGGIGENVDADGEGIGDVLGDIGRIVTPLAGAGELPIAGKILVAVDDAGAAAIFDALQVAGVGRIGADHVLHAPDRMAGRNGLQFVFGFGKDGGHELAQADVESARVAAAGFGEDEAAAVDIVAQFLRVRQVDSALGCR